MTRSSSTASPVSPRSPAIRSRRSSPVSGSVARTSTLRCVADITPGVPEPGLRKLPARYAAALVSPQGRKGNPAARAKPKAAPDPRPRKRLYTLIFAVLFIVLFAVIGVSVGIGEPSVPDDAIAVV